MKNWRKVIIGDLCDSVSVTYKGSDDEVVLINTSDVLDGEILNHHPVTNSNLKGQFKKTFQKDDILYSEIRPANKRFAYVDIENTLNYIASTKLMVLRPRKNVVEPRYIYMILKTPKILDELQHLAETRSGTFPQITFDSELATMAVYLPNKDTQKRIVSVVSAIEEKMKINISINNNLEEQAQALFKSWFVDFEPFGGVIPEGWEEKTIGELCESVSITRNKTQKEMIFLNTGDIDNGRFLHNNFSEVANMPGQAKKTIKKDDILYSEIRPVNRHFAYVSFDANDYVVSTKLMVIRCKEGLSRRIYHYLTLQSVIDELQIEAETRSGTFPQIRFENIKNIKIILADANTENKFKHFIEQIYLKMECNINENNNLSTLRDTLLPKLMSGEIDVSEIDI